MPTASLADITANPSASAARTASLADVQPTRQPSTMGGAPIAALVSATPAIATAALDFATSPAVKPAAAAIGRVLGGVAPIVGGAEYGPGAALAGVGLAAKGAWAGGKAGWFTGKLAQELAAPIANALQRVAPYAQVASHVTTPLAIYDLAQRLGPSNGKTDNPALLNDIAAVIMQHLGASPETVATVKAGRSESK